MPDSLLQTLFKDHFNCFACGCFEALSNLEFIAETMEISRDLASVAGA